MKNKVLITLLAGVLAAGVPCRVIREVGPDDRVTPLVPDAS